MMEAVRALDLVEPQLIEDLCGEAVMLADETPRMKQENGFGFLSLHQRHYFLLVAGLKRFLLIFLMH